MVVCGVGSEPDAENAAEAYIRDYNPPGPREAGCLPEFPHQTIQIADRRLKFPEPSER
jgi:hypothetical protein